MLSLFGYSKETIPSITYALEDESMLKQTFTLDIPGDPLLIHKNKMMVLTLTCFYLGVRCL